MILIIVFMFVLCYAVCDKSATIYSSLYNTVSAEQYKQNVCNSSQGKILLFH